MHQQAFPGVWRNKCLISPVVSTCFSWPSLFLFLFQFTNLQWLQSWAPPGPQVHTFACSSLGLLIPGPPSCGTSSCLWPDPLFYGSSGLRLPQASKVVSNLLLLRAYPGSLSLSLGSRKISLGPPKIFLEFKTQY